MGYTKVDNWLWDCVMPQAKPNTFKIVNAVVRQTAGWRLTTAVITFDAFQRLTGIANRGTICTAIDDAVDCEFITRELKGRSYAYSLKIVPSQSENRTEEQSENRTVIHTENRTVDSPKIVPSSYSINKKEKETKLNDSNRGSHFSFPVALVAYEQNIGPITKMVQDMVSEAAEAHSEATIVQAIEIAVAAERRNWGYVKGILNNWQTNGRQANGKATRSPAEVAWNHVMEFAAKGDIGKLEGLERIAATAVGGDKLRGWKPEQHKAKFMEVYDAARKDNLQPTS